MNKIHIKKRDTGGFCHRMSEFSNFKKDYWILNSTLWTTDENFPAYFFYPVRYSPTLVNIIIKFSEIIEGRLR